MDWAQSPDQLTVTELLEAVEFVNASIDASAAPAYQAQPLAQRWARVTKVCEESGEVWRAFSKLTGENPRKGVCGTWEELLGELGDCVSAALCAIQHETQDTKATWAIVSAALLKAANRVDDYRLPHNTIEQPAR
jgi:NTP pyrophosphatase (non-canonical NTP hydrolase)